MAPVNFDLVQELEAANAAAQAAIQDSPVGGGAGAQAVGTGAGAQLAGAAGVGAQADGAGAQPRGAMRWNNAMSSFVLCRMCQLISTGVRTDKGFKEVHLNQVAKAVQEFSGNKVTGNQVYNHLRKWRQRWIRVVKLRELSGALWDEENFMITLEDEHYAGHIKAHPKDAELLNKPIENYKQMEIIFGNGLATGKFAMGSGEALGSPSDFADSSVDGRVDEGGKIASEATKPLDVGAGSVSDEGRKRKRCMLSDGDIAVLDGMCDAVNNVADAIRETKVEEVPNGLYDAVMNMAGFTEEALMAAYSHLLDNKAHGVAFVGMTTSHRVLWLRTFLGKHYYI